MKKRVLSLLALAAAFALTACQGNAESDYSQPMETPGVAPYALSEEGEYLMQAYDLDDNGRAFCFRSPEGASGININAYTLSEEGKWVECGIGGLFYDESMEEGGLSGTFTLVLEKDGSITLNILGDGSSYQSASDPVSLDGYTGKMVGFLEEMQDAAVGEEIPVALVGYTSGTSMGSHELEDFFTPESLSGLDFAQAVTVEFTEEQTD